MALERKVLAKFDEFPATTEGWLVILHPNPYGRITPWYPDYTWRCRDRCEGKLAIVLADEPYPIVRKVSLGIQFLEPGTCWLHPYSENRTCIPQHTELQFIEPPTREQLCLRLKEICSKRLEQLTCSASPPTDS